MPRIHHRHFNIGGVAWSNFEPGVNVNGVRAVFRRENFDVVNVGAGVDEALVTLQGREEGGGRRGEGDAGVRLGGRGRVGDYVGEHLPRA